MNDTTLTITKSSQIKWPSKNWEVDTIQLLLKQCTVHCSADEQQTNRTVIRKTSGNSWTPNSVKIFLREIQSHQTFRRHSTNWHRLIMVSLEYIWCFKYPATAPWSVMRHHPNPQYSIRDAGDVLSEGKLASESTRPPPHIFKHFITTILLNLPTQHCSPHGRW